MEPESRAESYVSGSCTHTAILKNEHDAHAPRIACVTLVARVRICASYSYLLHLHVHDKNDTRTVRLYEMQAPAGRKR